MNTCELKAAVEAVEKARDELDEQTKKFTSMEARLDPARLALRDADERFVGIRGASILGESLPDAVEHARTARNDARDELAGLISAVRVLQGRVETASGALRSAEIHAVEATRPIAEALADEALKTARDAAAHYAQSLAHFHELHAVANGGTRATGRNEQNAHGTYDVLAEHGIRGTEYLQIGHPEGRGKLLTPSQILALATPAKKGGKAA